MWSLDRVPGSWGYQISRQLAHEGGKVISPTHRPPLAPGNIPGTHFCYGLSQPQGHIAAGRIMSLKNSNDNIGNRTRDFPACSAVPQPNAPPAACPTIQNNLPKLSKYIWLSMLLATANNIYLQDIHNVHGNVHVYVHACMVSFLFDNVIYIFLLLWLCILIVCLLLWLRFFLDFSSVVRQIPG
jgi:hypothetical protein